MLATLVIFLREGVEASMIVAILLAYLDRTNQRQYFRDVYLGVGAALVLAGGGGLVAYLTIRTYAGSRVQTIFETATYLLAAVILTYMTFWMRSHARGLKSELQSRADTAMSRGARTGLALVGFQAVGREGVETVVFTLAIAFSTKDQVPLLAGAVIGLAIALTIAFVMYRLGHRLNIGRLFTVVGTLLMIFAAGLLVDAVQNMQELGWLPVATHPLWHTGGVLNEDSALGDIAHSFFGYAQSPTVLQAVVYVLYLAVVLLAFFSVGRRARQRPGRA
jgi:high-affinity iron transporter